MTELVLRHVTFVPKALESDVLYVSLEHKVAVHLCACGCGSKVVVSLGPAEWSLSERNGRPTIRPSIGSGQLPCNSHYLITNGRIDWLPPISAAQTATSISRDHKRREALYHAQRKRGLLGRLWSFLLGLIGRR